VSIKVALNDNMSADQACSFIEEELTTGGQNYSIDAVLVVAAIPTMKDE